jgi:hypothetical protein
VKRILLVIGLCCFGSFSVAQRLPQIASPESYKLTFAPDLTKNTFAGDERIEVRVLKPTSEID